VHQRGAVGAGRVIFLGKIRTRTRPTGSRSRCARFGGLIKRLTLRTPSVPPGQRAPGIITKNTVREINQLCGQLVFFRKLALGLFAFDRKDRTQSMLKS